MIVNLPRYENGIKFWNKEDEGYNIDLHDYLIPVQSIDDFTNKLIKRIEPETIDDYEKIKDEVIRAAEKNVVLKYLKEQLASLEARKKLIFKDYPDNVKETYQAKLQPLEDALRKNNVDSSRFIINNKDECLKILSQHKLEVLNVLKTKRKESNKKYYEKRKELFKQEPRQLLTEEQKKENRKQANKSYYQNKHSTNKEPLIDEQKKERRRETNKKYYENRKTLQSEINELKAIVQQMKEQKVLP